MFCRYGSWESQLVYSKLLSQSFPTVDGIMAWLSVSILPPRITFDEATKSRVVVLAVDETCEGSPIVNATVELHKLEVVLSHRGILQEGQEPSEGGAVVKRKALSTSPTRVSSAAEASTVSVRGLKPRSRGGDRRTAYAVPDGLRSRAAAHQLFIDEELDIHGFLCMFLPIEVARQIIVDGRVTHALALLELTNARLRALGVDDESVRARVLEGNCSLISV
jgi:hypothetical protein